MKGKYINVLSRLVGFFLGIRVFVLLFFLFSLYVSSFFLFDSRENFYDFFLDYKAQGIIFCSLLSVASGSIINHLYDREKDKMLSPFCSHFYDFIGQKYFLYVYVSLNVFSLGIAGFLSMRIFIFFTLYQFFIWLYSHKVSKIFIANNLMYVILSLYPFFGMLVYYNYFLANILWMAFFLFLLMLIIDLSKDLLTKNPDKIFGYSTLPIVIGDLKTRRTVVLLLMLNLFVSLVITDRITSYCPILSCYYISSVFFFITISFLILCSKRPNIFFCINLLRLWVFIGVIFIFLNGIFIKTFHLFA